MRVLRLLGLGWWLQLKMLSRSAFDGVLGLLWPLFFATTTFFMYADAGTDALVYAGLGAAVMGIWSSTSTSASMVLQRERSQGTLELVVTAPVNPTLALLPVPLAMATTGLYSMVATLVWGRVLFGIEVAVADPVLFALAVLVTVLSIGALGFLLAMAAVRYRTSWALGAALELPVWLVCGFLVPVSLLPGWVRPVSELLAPTWGMRAVRAAAAGGSPLTDVAVCAALGAGYLLLGAVVADGVLRSARRNATLALS